MAYNNNPYKRYPNEYADGYQTYVDGNTVRKREENTDIETDNKQKRRKQLTKDVMRRRQIRERIVAARARAFDISFTFFVVFAVAVMVLSGIAAIKPISDAMKLKLEIKTLTADLFDAKKANNEFETDMFNKIDLDYVRQVAKSAGLSYPKSGQKVYVETADSDYCVQLIPLN